MSVATAVSLFTSELYRAIQESRGLSAAEQFLAQREFLCSRGLITEKDADAVYPFVPSDSPVPILLVSPRLRFQDVNRLMSEVCFKGNCGQNGLEAARLKDWDIIPEGPHVLIGVDDGGLCRGMPGRQAQQWMRGNKRHPMPACYMVWQAILFAEHILPRVTPHGLATDYDCDKTPFICLCGRTPTLRSSFSFYHDGSEASGAPSYHKIMGPAL